MLDKPKRFDQNKIWEEVIPPEELSSWIKYVLECISIQQDLEKLHIKLTVTYAYEDDLTASVNGAIVLDAEENDRKVYCYNLAMFSKGFMAKYTYNEYYELINPIIPNIKFVVKELTLKI